jgi:hypothetical protein
LPCGTGRCRLSAGKLRPPDSGSTKSSATRDGVITVNCVFLSAENTVCDQHERAAELCKQVKTNHHPGSHRGAMHMAEPFGQR